MWLAAVAARLAYLTHRLRGHVIVWRRLRSDLAPCPGDIICETCDRVLWCRAYDPWRPVRIDRSGNQPDDHWGRAGVRQPRWTLFDNLQQVLRLAAECPAGRFGDEMRRAACELTEAGSVRQRHTHRQRMLKAITRIQSRHAHGRRTESDPTPVLLSELWDVLCGEVRSSPDT
jgi:hypothetical protein